MSGSRPLALAVAVAGAVAVTACNRILGPTKTDTDWRIVESAHFSLHVRPGSFAEQSAPTLGQVLDDQYDVTLRKLNAQFGGRVNGFLYNNAADAGRESESSGTAYPDTAAFKATATPPLDGNLFALVSHEANHVITINALGRAGTYMMNEGLASALISGRFHPFGPHSYFQWTRTHRPQLVPVSRLSDDAEWPNLPQNMAYSASASFLAYLLETSGPDRLRQLYYARSGEFTARFAQIYGRTLADAESAWLAFCETQG
jgi:hypothetical protein